MRALDSSGPRSIVIVIVALGAVACGGHGPAAIDEEIVRHNNRGSAHMSRQEWSDAEREFRAGLALDADDPILWNNLATALVQQGRTDDVRDALGRALAIAPDDPHVRYNLGLIARADGEDAAAVEHFRVVARTDPDDVATQYNLAGALARVGRTDEAEGAFRAALRHDPTHVSSLYGLGRLLVRTGRDDEGGALIARSQEIRARSGIGEAMGSQYGEQGRYALVAQHPAGGLSAPADAAIEMSAGAVRIPVPATEHVVDLAFVGKRGEPRPIAVTRSALIDGGGRRTAMPDDARILGATELDVDGDGRTELAILIAVDDPPRATRLVVGRYAPDAWSFEHPWSGPAREFPTDAVPSADLAAVDLDHDGDVDLVWCWTSPDAARCRTATNDGAGRFAPPETDAVEFADPGPGPVRLAFADLDDDRDIDLVVGRPDGIRLYSNHREGRFVDISDVAGTGGIGPIPGPYAVADLDKDDTPDLIVSTADGPAVLRNRRGRFDAPEVVAPATGRATATRVADIDNDGFLDILEATEGGALRVVRNLGAAGWDEPSSPFVGGGPTPDRWMFATADDDGDGDLDVWVRTADGLGTVVNENATGHAWVTIDPVGVRDNTFGIGARVTVFSGGLRQTLVVDRPAPVHVGLGARDAIDAVRVLWPGGVVQDELEVAPGGTVVVEQLDRKGTSCPLLYAWRDRGWQFVTDFLGGCAIGYRLAPGVYSEPDTDEYVKIEGGLEAVDGEVRVRLNNQLEEVIWLDRVELLAVDHPEGTEVFPNERLMPGPPYPEFALYASSDLRPAVAARAVEQDLDVTPALRARDRRYVDGFGLLPFKGYAERHTLELDFGDRPVGQRTVLLLDGWIDYADSTANLAAQQAGAKVVPPRLAIDDGRGGWTPIEDHLMGFPAGLPKTMAVDLTGRFRGPRARLRIDTTMRIYWDRARLLVGGEDTSFDVHRLTSRSADLRFGGFPRETFPDGGPPNAYDPTIVDPTSPWKVHAGAYTAFGDVSELLAWIDDRMVTTRNGDEIELRFDVPPEPPPGSTRTWLLYADGFGKDMDPNSAANREVGPIPFHGMPTYPYPDDVVPPHEPPSDVRRVLGGDGAPAGRPHPGTFDRELREQDGGR